MVTVTSLNAADYGLVSGSSDQTAHLQAAINAAQTQGLPLFIPKGMFPISQVNITAPIKIYSTPGSAQIAGYGRAPTFNIAPTTAGNRFGPVSIESIFFNGWGGVFPTGGDSAFIQVSEVDDILVRDCTLNNVIGHGIYCYSSNGRIQSNRIVGMGEFGILCRDSGGAMIIDQNLVTYSGNNGIYIIRSTNGSDQSVISNNQIGFTSANRGGTGPYGNAIVVANANYVKAIDNMIYLSAFSAIRASNSNNIIVKGNHCYDSKDTAIYIEAPGAGGGVVWRNHLRKSDRYLWERHQCGKFKLRSPLD